MHPALKLLSGTTLSLLLASATFAQPAPRSSELNAQYRRAEVAWQSGSSLLEAKVRVDKVVNARPNDVEARILRARVLLSLGRGTEALQDAREAVRLEPGNGAAYVVWCQAARTVGQTAEAMDAMNRAAPLLEEPGLLLELSREAVALGVPERAEAFARIAAALDPTDSAAQLQLARTFVLQGRDGQAEMVLARAIKGGALDPAAIRSDSLLAPLATRPSLQRNSP